MIDRSLAGAALEARLFPEIEQIHGALRVRGIVIRCTGDYALDYALVKLAKVAERPR